jgi:hypothetical protein
MQDQKNEFQTFKPFNRSAPFKTLKLGSSKGRPGRASGAPIAPDFSSPTL